MSLTTNKVLSLMERRKAELQQMLEDHDCKESPESGCMCSDWKQELGYPDVGDLYPEQEGLNE